LGEPPGLLTPPARRADEVGRAAGLADAAGSPCR